MKRLNQLLQNYMRSKLEQGEVDLEVQLKTLEKDFRYGYFFQLVIVGLIFALTVIAIVVFYQESSVIASMFGVLGIGGVGWFLQEVRKSMREYALIHLLLTASRSLSQQQLDVLIAAVARETGGGAAIKAPSQPTP